MEAALSSYHAPRSFGEATQLLAGYGHRACILAGGQSLLPELRKTPSRAVAFIDLGRLTELNFIQAENGMIRIGAMVRYSAIERSALVREHLPILAEAVRHIASRAIRHRGTIGGNLSQADPRSELGAIVVLLDGHAVVRKPDGGVRSVPAAEFIHDGGRASLLPAEVLYEVRIPEPAKSAGWGFSKFSLHPNEYGLFTVGVMLVAQDSGNPVEVHLSIGASAVAPRRIIHIENVDLANPPPTLEDLDFDGLVTRMAANMDGVVSADYLRHALSVVVRRTLATAWAKMGDRR